MKRIIMFLFFLFMSLKGNTQEVKKNYEDAFKLIEIWLEAQKDFENIPGIVAMVVNDQDILWKGAFGKSNVEQNIKIDTTTICSICSITKTFTAIAIMKLVEEGKLNLNDKVKDLLPFYKVRQKFPEGGAITIKSLLSHTSGLPGNTGQSYFSGPVFTFPSQKEFRNVLKEIKTKNTVGTDIDYSNVGYALLGEIIEKISGVSYKKYLVDEVLHPLNMTETYLESNTITNNKKAVGYTALNRNRARNKVNTFLTKSMKPAMGLWTNIDDLAKYASWQFRLRDAINSEVLKPNTLKRMHNAHATSLNGNMSWGLGFEVIKDSKGNDWISHGGTCPGFVSLFQLNLTTKMGIAIIINTNRAFTFRYINGIKQILSKVKPVEELKNNVNLKDYIGFYNLNPWNSEMYVSTWGNDLVMLQLPENSPKYSMMFYRHIKDDIFRQIKENGKLGGKFIFERDKNGKVYRFLESGNYKYKMDRKNRL